MLCTACSRRADGRDSFHLWKSIACTTESLQAGFKALSTATLLPVIVPEIEGERLLHCDLEESTIDTYCSHESMTPAGAQPEGTEGK